MHVYANNYQAITYLSADHHRLTVIEMTASGVGTLRETRMPVIAVTLGINQRRGDWTVVARQPTAGQRLPSNREQGGGPGRWTDAPRRRFVPGRNVTERVSVPGSTGTIERVAYTAIHVDVAC